jgi:putative restriction endonuclease
MPTGFIGLTDPDWYRFLHANPRLDEVNFWRPHGELEFRALQKGEPFFFKLRAPGKAIAGFAYFERFESMPAWLAWDCFGEMNGAADFGTMVGRIRRLRGDTAGVDRAGDFKIGCVILLAPVFFAENEWVDPPADWARTGIQVGKTYDLEVGEGRRVLSDCIARARTGDRYWNADIVSKGVAGSERYGAPIEVRPRLGQGSFSLAVRDAYSGACAVTHEHSTPVLEAAHIRPYADGGEHRVDNGLLLRRDLHRLFDRGYVTVTPDHRFRVGERLRAEFKNGRSYYALNNSKIALPIAERLQPSRELLAWHGTAVFKG